MLHFLDQVYFINRKYLGKARWEAAWRYVKCVGGIWTHRQAEQNWFPVLIALLTDDPEKRMHTFSDIVLAHKLKRSDIY